MTTKIFHYTDEKLLTFTKLSTDTLQEIADYINATSKKDNDFFLVQSVTETIIIEFETYYPTDKLFQLTIKYSLGLMCESVFNVYNDEITTIHHITDKPLKIRLLTLAGLLQDSLEFIPDRHID